MKIKWQDKVPDTEVLNRSSMPSIHTLLRKTQLRWAGHVSRMPEHRIPKRIFYGELAEGARLRGGQKKRYKDTLKIALKDCNIDPDDWETVALDRPTWRSAVTKGAANYEAHRIQTAQRKRSIRKEMEKNKNQPDPSLPCPHCTRRFRAQIGLTSHLWTHGHQDG